jgi:hypothetical protein
MKDAIAPGVPASNADAHGNSEPLAGHRKLAVRALAANVALMRVACGIAVRPSAWHSPDQAIQRRSLPVVIAFARRSERQSVSGPPLQAYGPNNLQHRCQH